MDFCEPSETTEHRSYKVDMEEKAKLPAFINRKYQNIIIYLLISNL